MFETSKDWTAKYGRSNMSDDYLKLVGIVERLIRNDAFSLINGHVDMTARLIVSQLAHKYGLAPTGPLPDEDS